MAARLDGSSQDRRVRVQGRPVDSYPRFGPEVERGAVHRITVVGDDVLRRRCQEVTAFGTAELSRLIDDMFATNRVARGAGLAANQIGVDLRVFMWDITDDWGFGMSGTSSTRFWTRSRPKTAGSSTNPRGACPCPAPTVWCPARTVPWSAAGTRTAHRW